MRKPKTFNRISRSRRTNNRRGAALTEFAIVAPFLMLMLMGMIEFGRAMMIQQAITNAAREAAREATLPSATEDSVEAVASQFVSHIATGEMDVDISFDTNDPNPDISDAEPGDLITVEVSLPLSAVSKFGATWFGSDFTLLSSASMRKEGFD